MSPYEELLETGSERILDFLKNYPLHDSQFKYGSFNVECYEKMYVNNSQDNVRSVKDLKLEIEELKATCKECGNFFMKQRNNSIKKYDVMLGRLLEDVVIEYLKLKYKLNVTHADESNKKYPDCMLLSGDKGILAYFEVKYHGAPFISAFHKIGRYCYEGSVTLDLDKVKKQIEIAEAELDRPVFYLHWVDFPCLKGIFFETSEQVKNELFIHGEEFERKKRTGDYDENRIKRGYTKKFYSKLLEMGSFEELIDIFLDMKKKGVVMY